MKLTFIFFAIILFASPLWITNVFAQEDDTPHTTTQDAQNVTEVVEIKVGPSPDVTTESMFPNSTHNNFYIGKRIPVLVGLNNIGSGVFNVTHVGSSLMYPQDHRYYIQNYTKGYYGETVSPSELRSFLYTFYPDPMLEPRQYGLVVSIYYTDAEGTNFTNVVFNNTINLVETDESIDAQALFLYVGILGVAGLVGFIVYKAARTTNKKKGPKRVEYGTQKSTVIDNEWLEGTSAFRSPKVKTVKTVKTVKKTN